MSIGDLLGDVPIAPRALAADKRLAVSIVAEMAARHFRIDAAGSFDALWARETAGSTGVGHGVAIPHAFVPGLARVRGVFLRLETPVDFGAVDDEPVDLIFALLSPRERGADHLRALARVSRLMRQPRLREQLRAARAIDAIHALLVQEARSTAA
jgi:PTS system nitrogen regulatory IIA component